MTVSEPQPRRKLLFTPGRRPLSEPYSQCFQNYYHAYQYLQPTPLYLPNVRLSVNHWQLRDLVQIDPHLGTLYHTCDDAVRELSPLSRRARQARLADYARFPFFPRCFNHAEGGMIVAGSVLTLSSRAFSMAVPSLFGDRSARRPQKGLFSVFTPEMPEPLTYKLGEMINNAVAVYRDLGGGYTSYVCNNDTNLYTVDIGSSGVCANRKITCEANVSLNNARLSPDGKVVAVTGDASSLYLVDPAAPLAVRSVKTGRGSGFGISFHSNGVTMAASFEDGVCLLYDMRNMHVPLHEVRSTRPGHQAGAFRCCKFLDSFVQDLLVVLEHAGRVHLVDLRNLTSDSQQVLVFPFALDQYGRCQAGTSRKGIREDAEADATPTGATHDDMVPEPLKDDHPVTHRRLDIYGENPFPVPLVYDYSYLADTNPKLFKDFEYEPAGDDSPRVLRFVHDSYQQAVNHAHGEMELAGLDWFEDQLYIGCDDGGVLCWDINVRARRSFGGYLIA